MATPIKLRKTRDLTQTEERLVDAFLATGDINQAALACDLPVSTAQVFLERPHVKRLVQSDSGYAQAHEMNDALLLDEILLAVRGAVRAESYAAAMQGYKLFYDIRNAATAGPVVSVEADVERTRDRLRRLTDG